MDLGTIAVSPEEAVAKLAEYKEALGGHTSAEDDALRRAYRAARRGRPIISLPDTIHAGGYFDSGLPRIAVVRADAEQCFVTRAFLRAERARFVFASAVDASSRGALVGRRHVQVDVAGPGVRTTTWRGRAVVPLVPPDCRPRRPRLGSTHVLWEVEEWGPAPPVDPALLQHIRGDLWAVLAAWELTELERAVLSQRRP